MRALSLAAAALAVVLASPAQAQDAGPADAGTPADGAIADASVPCGNIDSLGQCLGTVVQRCQAGSLFEEDCALSRGVGFTCRLEPGLGAAQCTLLDADAGVFTMDPDGGASPVEEEDSGAHCVKPAWGSPGALMLGLWWVGPRRRRRR